MIFERCGAEENARLRFDDGIGSAFVRFDPAKHCLLIWLITETSQSRRARHDWNHQPRRTQWVVCIFTRNICVLEEACSVGDAQLAVRSRRRSLQNESDPSARGLLEFRCTLPWMPASLVQSRLQVSMRTSGSPSRLSREDEALFLVPREPRVEPTVQTSNIFHVAL